MTNAWAIKQMAKGKLDHIHDTLFKGRELPEKQEDFAAFVTEMVAFDKEMRADIGRTAPVRNEAPAKTTGIHPDVQKFMDAQKARQQKEEQNKFNPGANMKSDAQSGTGHYTGNFSPNK
jgi:hypothetical protein